MTRLGRFRSDLLALLVILLLALLWFAPVLVPSITAATLLPYDNLSTFDPWRSLQAGRIPYNDLLSDLVLQNAAWKLHLRESLAAGEIPLWNPKILTGVPFLAGGQASALYPLNFLFYLLPLEIAYGWFTALQVAIAGAALYGFGRVLRLRVLAALFGAIVYMFSGFLIASVVFTMFLAAVPWLPLLLAVIELIVRKQEEKGVRSFLPIPYVAAGAAVVGLVVLAGHPELIYYTLLVAGAFSGVRLVAAYRRLRAGSAFWPALACTLRLAGWLATLALLGVAVGAAQLIPLVELLPHNFREGNATLQQVTGWAWPSRHLLTFALPNLFGNPSHHGWFDLWERLWQPATTNALGEPAPVIFWGIKNYVEGGSYVGVVTWLLAGTAVLAAANALWRRDRPPTLPGSGIPGFFAALAVVSLLFAFGTPLYALLFYGLPGWNQLHSPFRWVFPFTLSMAVLGAVGAQHLLGYASSGGLQRPVRRAVQSLALLALLVGGSMIGLVLASLLLPGPFIALGQRIVDGSDLAQRAFASGRMFWSYQAANLVHGGLAALLAGLLVGAGMRWPGTRWLGPALVALVCVDLFVAHGTFNPASDPALAPWKPAGKPAVVDFLNEREATRNTPWRFTTFNAPGEKTFNANMGMYYGWHDVRGYDSVILRQYVDFMNRIQPQANELLYNRIAPIYAQPGGDVYAALDNPLLDLLNIQYLITEHAVPNPGWAEIYQDDSVRVYENLEAFPRALILPAASVVPAAEQPLTRTDLRSQLFLEEPPADPNGLLPASPALRAAQISRYTANEVFVDVNLSDRGWLLLTDAYFPGWKAYLRPFGGDENQEVELPIQRANSAFRAVYLAQDGQWTVRFVYSPMSFKLGLYTSFLAGMTVLMLLLFWIWGRYYRPEIEVHDVKRVAKNSLVPMGLSLFNKAVDFAFALLYVRLLGPAGTGEWYFVVAIYGFFEIVSRYGLGTLLTRDVAADKNQASRYLTNVLALRTLLWVFSLPLMGLVVSGYWAVGVVWPDLQSIHAQEIQALLLLAAAMLFANYADALSSLFMAFEKMEYPAGLTNAVALLKVALGALVLLLDWGYIGLAAVALAVNLLQVVWLYALLRAKLLRPHWQWDGALQRWMLAYSGPLMINHLLATIFWRIDVWILRPLAGSAAVGLYSIGLKYLDGLNIIPSMFTMAIFPLMSRFARSERNNLLRSYVLSLRLLTLLSLPVAMAVTFLATPLVYLVGGAQYLNIPGEFQIFGRSISYMGGADVAFQAIVWSIPIGFVNSVTQYVLIAANQQQVLTRAFVFGVLFNIVGNLLLIPRLGYIGAATATILSEFSLLFPFYWIVRRSVGTVPWGRVFGPPLLAVAAMGCTIWLLQRAEFSLLLALPAGLLVYVAVLPVAGAFRGEEMALVMRALPIGPLRRLPLKPPA